MDVKSIFEKQIQKRGWILGSQGKSYLGLQPLKFLS